MKRIVALFLIAALLLGVLGTSAFAAEAAALTIPEFSASIAADGSITVTVGGGKTYETAWAYVSDGSGFGAIYVWLKWDEEKKAYVNGEVKVAGSELSSIFLSTYTYKYSDDGTTDTFDKKELDINYENGKLNLVSAEVSKGSEKQTEYTYIDYDGKKQNGSSMATVEAKGERTYAFYDTDTGKKTDETHIVFEKREMEKLL